MELGATGLEISRVGFGAWAIGGADARSGWGHQDDDLSVEAIRRALELGVNWIDTAPIYGVGHSEEVVGRALKDVAPAQRPYVFTKCSVLQGPDGRVVHDLSRESLLREVEGSLTRLGIDRIDVYQIHWPLPESEIADGWSALADLKRQGLVRHIGVSNFSAEQLRRIAEIAPVETLQPPYSLVARDIEASILPYAQEARIGVIAYSPMASGLLSGGFTRERIATLPDDDWRRRDPLFGEPALTSHLALVDRLRAVGERYDAPPGAVAVAWVLAHGAVHGAIVGFRRPDQVAPILRGADLRLTSDDLREIEAHDPRKGTE